MANKIIQTRIKNRFDLNAAWENSNPELLPGEIALVKVPTEQTYTNPVTGKTEPVIEILMKVGEEGKKFKELPWLSAKAADVYSWAKTQKAADVEVTLESSKTYAANTLGGLFQAVTSNDSDIANLQEAIDKLNGDSSTGESIADRIKTAIEALDHVSKNSNGDTVNSQPTNTIVKTVTQTDGVVTVTYGSITEAELPNINASKIIVTTDKTLDEKLSEIDSAIAAIPGSFSAENSGSGVVKSISYDEEGTFTATKATVDTAEITDSAVTTAKIANSNVTTTKIADSAVTNAKIDSVDASKVIINLGSTEAQGLPAKLDALDASIAGINAAITGGVHFIGTTTTDVTTDTNKASKNVTINSKTVEANQGDIVIYSTREFIWTGSIWEELGDVTRVGTLETWRSTLNESTTNTVATTHAFVSQVTQDDGKIAVTYTRPEADDVVYSTTTTESGTTTTTVADELAAHTASISGINEKLNIDGTVTAYVAGEIAELDSIENGSGDFVIGVSQTNGKVTVTKGSLPIASTSAQGIVQLSDTITGEAVTVDSTTAATTKAVKLANANATDAQSRVATVEEKFVRMEEVSGKTGTYTIHMGSTNTDTIIFDCGGAQ